MDNCVTFFIYSVLSCGHVEIKGKYREITESVTSVCVFYSTHKERFMSHGDKNNFLISKAGNDHRHQPCCSSTLKSLSPRCRRMTLILASTRVDSLVVKSQCGKIQPRFRPPLTHTHTHPLMCADVMLVSQLLAGMFSLAAIYGDLTEVTA